MLADDFDKLLADVKWGSEFEAMKASKALAVAFRELQAESARLRAENAKLRAEITRMDVKLSRAKGIYTSQGE